MMRTAFKTSQITPRTGLTDPVTRRTGLSPWTISVVIGGFVLIGLQTVILLVLAWVLPHNPHMWSGPLGFVVLADFAVRLLTVTTLIAACVLSLRRSTWAIGFAIVWMCLHFVWVPVAFFAFAARGEPSPEALVIVLVVLLAGMPPAWAQIVGMGYWLVPIALPLVQVWRIAIRDQD